MGIFASRSKLWTRYRARIQFRAKLIGGVPKNPEIVEGWIRSKSGVTDEEEIQSMVRRAMIDQGTWHDDMTEAEIAAASKSVAQMKQTTGFKGTAPLGLYIESRQIKAGIKEATNILYAGEKWGPTRKGPRQFLAERVFVTPDELYMGQDEPDGVELMIGQVAGPQGKRSTLGYHEYTIGSTLEFDVLVANDAIKEEWWIDIWTLMEENGLGALRSQGHGKFDLLAWDRIPLESNAPGAGRARSRPSETNTPVALPGD